MDLILVLKLLFGIGVLIATICNNKKFRYHQRLFSYTLEINYLESNSIKVF